MTGSGPVAISAKLPSSAAVAGGRTVRLPTVVVLDGCARHRDEIRLALGSFYTVHIYADAARALDHVARERPTLMIVDAATPPFPGHVFLDLLADTLPLADLPLICTGVRGCVDFHDRAQELGAVGYFIKPYRASDLLQLVSSTISRSVEREWDALPPTQKCALQNTVTVFNGIADAIAGTENLPYETVREGCAPLVQAVADAQFADILNGVRAHDNYTYAHSLRVATFLSLFAHGLGLRGEELSTVTSGGLMHDIGKMGIPLAVLNKPGRLDGEEWKIMRSHVDRTLDVLKSGVGVPHGALVIAGQHHEKLDGTGYPRGLKGPEVNELARMAAISDVFSALTDRRVYKDPIPAEKALNIMVEMSTALDQRLLALFREMLLDVADQLDA